MVREWSRRIAAVAAVVTGAWLFTAGSIAVALSALSVLLARNSDRPSLLVLIQLVIGVIVLAAAVTVGQAVPRIWAGGSYRRRAVAFIALVTTLLATLGLLITQQAGLVAIVVPSLTLLRLSSRTTVSLTGYRTGPPNTER